MIDDGRVKGVVTTRGTIHADHVVVCAGLWGRLIAEMAGEDLPVMPVDHPLTSSARTTRSPAPGSRSAGRCCAIRATPPTCATPATPGPPKAARSNGATTRSTEPRLVHPRDLLEKEQARLSPSQRDLDMEQVLAPLERAMELTPILGELGYNEGHSFNGLLQTTTDGGPSMGESQKVRGLWYAVGIWVKDGPGMGKLIADWMTDGRTAIDHNRIDYARFNPFQLEETSSRSGAPRPHPRSTTRRCTRASPSPAPRHPPLAVPRAREGARRLLHGARRLGARHGYAATSTCWTNTATAFRSARTNGTAVTSGGVQCRASRAERGLRHRQPVALLRLRHRRARPCRDDGWLCVARIGGDANIGKGIYTHFLDDEGMVRADFTVIRMADRCRMINGADAGPRDFHYMRRVAEDKGFDVTITDVSEKFVTIGIWGPNARAKLQTIVEDPDGLEPESFPFAAIRPIRVAGKAVTAFRISYVGEQGWELHMPYDDGLAVWDALRSTGAIAVGVETYANTRRLEKSLRLQNADLLTEYNLLEADLARPKVKEADFRGKAKHLEYRARDHQPAMLCTLVMTANVDRKGVARYPLGTLPVLDPETGETLVDELGRRSFTTSIAFGPSVGKNIALAYLPWAYCQEGRKLAVEYFGEAYPVEVVGIGYRPLYDPDNSKPRS